jgi:hypothetical protein
MDNQYRKLEKMKDVLFSEALVRFESTKAFPHGV